MEDIDPGPRADLSPWGVARDGESRNALASVPTTVPAGANHAV